MTSELYGGPYDGKTIHLPDGTKVVDIPYITMHIYPGETGPVSIVRYKLVDGRYILDND